MNGTKKFGFMRLPLAGPEDRLFKSIHTQMSAALWAVRFAASQDQVMMVHDLHGAASGHYRCFYRDSLYCLSVLCGRMSEKGCGMLD